MSYTLTDSETRILLRVSPFGLDPSQSFSWLISESSGGPLIRYTCGLQHCSKSSKRNLTSDPSDDSLPNASTKPVSAVKPIRARAGMRRISSVRPARSDQRPGALPSLMRATPTENDRGLDHETRRSDSW